MLCRGPVRGYPEGSGVQDGPCLYISGKRQSQGWQCGMAIAAIGTWQRRKCSAEVIVLGSSDLCASCAAAGETLPPPLLASPTQQEPAPFTTWYVWAAGPFLPPLSASEECIA